MTLELALKEANILLSMKPDCRACGMGTACCGCPEHKKYLKERDVFFNSLNKDATILGEIMDLAVAMRDEARLKKELANAQERAKMIYEILADKLEQADEVKTNIFGD